MSDTFDHEADAWDSYERRYDGMDWDSFHGGHRGMMNEPDPDFYHSWEAIDKIEKESEKAILVSVEGLVFWVAKSLIRRQKDGYILIHSAIFEESKSKARQARKQMERLNIASPIIDPFKKYRK